MTDHHAALAAARTEAIRQAARDLVLESGYAKLSIEAVASRAGVGKHTIYRRWPSKGLLFLDAVLSLNTEDLVHRDTSDVVADTREVMVKATELLSRPPWGPLYRALLGEAQHDPDVAAGHRERFIRRQTDDLLRRLQAAKEQGQIAPDFELELAMDLLSGALYYRFLCTREPITRDYIDRLLNATSAGMSPRP
ncbi:TetR/AcrR family transcriptional regulator [Actinomadura sp. NAK00032]|uniref:TetR/AcrR family transcriptional regulator n=1 Tax=Actinomadura sp. NAK00032 TaxID=2742128 RepID=UPI0015903E85|nr:TetR/AcrR family transcriptional regulator [Actinomadura sp. NAK00032]QKW38320.1 TetR/AcrR family transcriptional regulator [Actinomadura sp. NAK00032]